MSNADTNEEELSLEQPTGGDDRSEDAPSGGGSSRSDGEEEESSAGDSESSEEYMYKEIDPVDKLVRALRVNDKRVRKIDLTIIPDDWILCQAQLNKDVVSIFEALQTNTTVRVLELQLILELLESDCKIDQVGSQAIGDAVAKNASITHLSIDGRVFGSNSHGAEQILHGMMFNTTIRKVEIFGHYRYEIDDAGAPQHVLDRKATSQLSAMISKSKTIEVLEFGHNVISWHEDTEILCEGLALNTSIKSIKLYNNDFMEASHIGMICSALGDRAKVRFEASLGRNITVVLRNNKNIEEARICINGRVESYIFRDLSMALKQNRQIRYISFSSDSIHTEIQMNDLIDLTKAVSSGSVEKFALLGMNLDDAQLEATCKILATSTSLREFAYSTGRKDKMITAKSAHSFARFLIASKSVESFNFKSNQSGRQCFGDEGSLAIARAVLQRSARTTKIGLRDCGMGNGGAAAFFQLVASPTSTIQELDISMNDFGFSICKKFADCLENNSCLEKLYLGGPREGESIDAEVDMQTHLVSALAHNKTLKRLMVPYASRVEDGEKSWEAKADLRNVIQKMLLTNHVVVEIAGCNCGLEENIRENKNHPILASTLKKSPFPVPLIQNLAEREIACAIERAEDVAGIDGVFSLVRQMGDAIATRALSKKRGREE